MRVTVYVIPWFSVGDLNDWAPLGVLVEKTS